MDARESERNTLLERLIRLDSKDSHFLYRDKQAVFKISYPQTNVECGQMGDLFPQFWHHVQAYYFKNIEEVDLQLLDYISSLFTTFQNKSQGLGNFDEDFLDELSETIQPALIQRALSQYKTDVYQQIWLKSLYANWKIEQLDDPVQTLKVSAIKNLSRKLKTNRELQRLTHFTKRQKIQLAKEEADLLDQLLILLQHSLQLSFLSPEAELAHISSTASKIVKSIQNKVITEQQLLKRKTTGKKSRKDNDGIENQDQLKCVAYVIRFLEGKQKAESISKVIQSVKYEGEYHFKVTFQKAIHIENKFITEKELTKYNYLREPSLLSFYRTSLKSLYSFVCHNYVGFRELLYSRCNLYKLKGKCMLEMMKKGAYLGNLSEIQSKMAHFYTCHHCKHLYPDELLVTCKFRSDKQAMPRINHDAAEPQFHDIPVHETSGSQRNRISQRFATRRRNCMTAYAKIDDQYVCGRKYCMACIKDNYSQDSIKQSGICPFCEGVCLCSRCLRSEKIVRLKLLYTLLGGEIEELNATSSLEQLENKAKLFIPRGRGRPKKNVGHISVNSYLQKSRKFQEKSERRLKQMSHHTNGVSRVGIKDIVNETSDGVVKRKRGRPSKNEQRMRAIGNYGGENHQKS